MPASPANPQSQARDLARTQFLASCTLADATVHPLAQDASFRRYFRISANDASAKTGSGLPNSSYILMDAPPGKEPVAPFLKIREHLQKLGLRPPHLLHADTNNGFILLEDLGHNTYTRLLNAGASDESLYRQAVNVLVSLHEHAQALSIEVPAYDTQRLVDEAMLFVDWYVPAVTEKRLGNVAREQWRNAWETTINSLPVQDPSLVLRDFHVDNLMQIEEDGQEACALLDFQDAVAGSAAYDLVSLLEDARRDLPNHLIAAMRQHYTRARPSIREDDFQAWYQVLGAQRHAKVLGIFMRLWIRDDKPVYLEHMPRVTRLFRAKKDVKELKLVSAWVEQHLPNIPTELPAINMEQARQLCLEPIT